MAQVDTDVLSCSVPFKTIMDRTERPRSEALMEKENMP